MNDGDRRTPPRREATKRLPHRGRRASMGALRVCLLLGVSGVLSASLLTRALGHELGAAVLRGGRVIWGIASPHSSNAPQRLVLNGAELFVQTGTVQAPWEGVLDEVRQACVGDAASSDLLVRTFARRGVIERRTQREGTVACLEGANPVHFAALSRIFQGRPGLAVDAGESMDVGALGALRYTYARREAEHRTAVLGVWSTGPLDVGALFPADGDAPGEADPELPRPRGSVRTLSVRHEALALPLVVYRAPGGARAVAASYAEDLRRAGFDVIDAAAPSSTDGANAARAWFARSAAHTRFVTLVEEDGGTWVVSTPLP